MCKVNLYFIIQTAPLLRVQGTVLELCLSNTFKLGPLWVTEGMWSPKGVSVCDPGTRVGEHTGGWQLPVSLPEACQFWL